MPAGLLVLPRAGQEHRHVDLVDEGVRRDRAATSWTVRVVLDLLHEVGLLQAQLWFSAQTVSPPAMRRGPAWP